jgi:PIN domain nuclease of toxin-antitoxin system
VTVLDTHAWLWWVGDPARLGRAGRREIDQAELLGIPAICCLEVAALAARGRVELDRPVLEWLHAALALPRVASLPLTPAVAVRAAHLPSSFPGDPADRLITATAIIESATLVTKDQRLRAFADVKTVW